jgi:hypothetical protein
MAPIRKGDGTGFTPKGFAGVRKGDGTILYSAEPAIPDSGVSRWKYEDDSDTSTAIDSWGTEDGSISGATYTTDSQVGTYALSFDGADDSVGPFTNSAYSFTNNFSLSAWVKINTDETRNPILVKGFDRAVDSNVDYSLTVGGDRYQIKVSDGSNSDKVNISGNTTGVWKHLCGTYDGSQLKLYIDGVEEGSVSSSINIADNWDLYHGFSTSSKGTSYFNGIIDDPRIYSKALTATEADNLYNTGSISG